MIKVGMKYGDALSMLKKAKAKEVQMEFMDETETEKIHTFELANGNVVIVSVKKSDKLISSLEVCTNPEEPKSKRNWKSVQEIELGEK